MTLNSLSNHQNRILPELRRIQDRYGYLNREELERFSKNSGIPLYRLQEIASFFPHFHLKPPKAVTVKVCESMACALAPAVPGLDELRSMKSDSLRVEGVSCLGRCDRAPAVCIAVGQLTDGAEEHEFYYLGSNASNVREVVLECLQTKALPAAADRDSNQGRYPSESWVIDPYKGRTPDYQAVKKVLAHRDSVLREGIEALKEKFGSQAEAAELIPTLRNLYEAMKPARDVPILPVWVNAVFDELDQKNADLRGMGGGGIPARKKWGDVRAAVANARKRGRDERAFVVVNGDESEPGTFKDRELLLHFPHLIVEAVILAGLVTDATEGFIYIRHEYSEQIDACRAEIERAEEQGLCGTNARVLGRPFPISVFVSPGGYICGEQSALIEAMSDRRGEPRNLPPLLETNGLNDLPTLVSNVETFAWVPYILINGGAHYASQGVNGRKGRRFFSVCGDVKRPGVYEVPMGLTLRELIYSSGYCQGISGDKNLKAIAPSGPSGGFLPTRIVIPAETLNNPAGKREWEDYARRRNLDGLPQDLDILDFELELNLFRSISPTQMLGAGIVVYSEDRDMAEHAVSAIQFFRNESCGKCVPCRVGSKTLANLGSNLLDGRVDTATWDNDLLPIVQELETALNLSSICGLGRSVSIPLRTLTEYFGEDLLRRLKQPEPETGNVAR